MKKLTNMTTHSFDLERFGNNAGLKEFLRRHSLDGLELMEIGEDGKQIFKKKMWSVFIGSIIPAGIVSGKKTLEGAFVEEIKRRPEVLKGSYRDL